MAATRSFASRAASAATRVYRGVKATWPGWLSCLLVFAWYLRTKKTFEPYLIQSDGAGTYMWARTLVFDHDLDVTNDHAICGLDFGPPEHGTAISYWNIGTGVLIAPFLALGRFVLRHHRFSSVAEAAGCSGPLAAFAMIGSAALAVGALAFGYAIAQRHVGRHWAAFAVLLVGLGSPLFWYGAVNPSYSHSASAFACAALLFALDRLRSSESVAAYGLLGALGGLVLLVRTDSVVFGVPVAIAYLRSVRRERWRNAVVRGLVGVASALLVFSPQVLVWHRMWGGWFREGHGGYMRLGAADFIGPLFFPFSGLLFNSPSLWLAVLGLVVALWRRAPRAAALDLVIGLVGTWFVIATAYDWWGAAGYPGRRFCQATVCFVVGAAFGFDAVAEWVARRPRLAVGLGATLAVLFAGVASRTWPSATDRVAKGSELHAEWARDALRYVDRHVGHPLAWPGELPFSLRYGAPPSKWDLMSPFSVTWRGPKDATWASNRLDPTHPIHAQYYVAGFAPDLVSVDGISGREFCRGRLARLLVPLFSGRVASIGVWLRSTGARTVEFHWNGHAHTLPADVTWKLQAVALDASETHPGINELTAKPDAGCALLSTLVFEHLPGRP